MRSNKSVISAMIGIAFLAVPITAAAHPRDNQRHPNPAPAFHSAPARAFRPAARRFNAPMNFRAASNVKVAPAPRPWNRGPEPAFNRPLPPAPPRFIQPRPLPPVWSHVPPGPPAWVPPGHRRDYTWTPRHTEPYRDGYRTVCDGDGDDCRQVPYDGPYTRRPMPYRYERPARYVRSYAPDYADYNSMPYVCDEDGDDCRPNQSYDGSCGDLFGGDPQAYFSPMPNEGLLGYRARLQEVRARALANYRLAQRRGNRRRADAARAFIRHINARLGVINRRIAAQSGGYAYTPAASLGSYGGAYANPYANTYNPYGYGGGLSSAVAPLLGNFVP